MTCIANQQSLSLEGIIEPIKHKKSRKQVNAQVYDEEARRFRILLANQEALHQLEMRKSDAYVAAYRISFIR
jgi:hypothetical protein